MFHKHATKVEESIHVKLDERNNVVLSEDFAAFLNGHLNEDVYASQTPCFEDDKLHHNVYILNKALYGCSSYVFKYLSPFIQYEYLAFCAREIYIAFLSFS